MDPKCGSPATAKRFLRTDLGQWQYSAICSSAPDPYAVWHVDYII